LGRSWGGSARGLWWRWRVEKRDGREALLLFPLLYRRCGSRGWKGRRRGWGSDWGEGHRERDRTGRRGTGEAGWRILIGRAEIGEG